MAVYTMTIRLLVKHECGITLQIMEPLWVPFLHTHPCVLTVVIQGDTPDYDARALHKQVFVGL